MKSVRLEEQAHSTQIDREAEKQIVKTLNCTLKYSTAGTLHYNAVNIVVITGCAVAQHCYNGDVSFLWEKWKL